MNIRLYNEKELHKLINIWYEGSLIAHDFIDQNYWKSQRKAMKEKYLPMAKTYVLGNSQEIVGFISMVDDYLAALFIDIGHQGKGHGKKLLHFIKNKRKKIHLKVYKKNSQAVHFYLKNGFVIKDEFIDKQTAEEEFLMVWRKVELH